MHILGIDTALRSCSAALLRDGEAIAWRRLAMDKGHAEHLAPMARDVLAEAPLAARDLDRIGVVIGPGSFAGVRVGLAFARALALGTRVNVVGVTSLEALAAGARGAADRLVAAVVDARREQVFAALYASDGAPIVPPFVASPEAARARLIAAAEGRSALVTGDGAALVNLPPAFRRAGADDIDPIIVARLAAAAPQPAGPPAPLYLRAPDAKPAAPSRFAGLFGDAP
jgi:tRNA threonylcarbamoyladenosine biosynthesis protein TsaB